MFVGASYDDTADMEVAAPLKGLASTKKSFENGSRSEGAKMQSNNIFPVCSVNYYDEKQGQKWAQCYGNCSFWLHEECVELEGEVFDCNKSRYRSLFGITFQDGDRFNSCQAIYSQFGLAIRQNDHQARRRFVEWAQNEIAVVPDFHKQILFSDEAHF
ncbi:hypothetical protein TNCV_1427001 [Trichonephila clavipes]|nr:hypothetical protein TNCV_1427001 [Trichonephila clavipes]